MERLAARILLVDDHQLFREGTANLLASEEGMRVVGAASSVGPALDAVAKTRPDIVLVDINLPDENGFHFLREMAKDRSAPRVIVLSGYEDVGYMRSAFKLGAFGFLCKSCSRQELVDGIQKVHSGQLVFTHEILAERGRAAVLAPAAPTKREMEVLSAIRRGLSNKQIASVLYVSERTVHFHIGNVFTKLNVSSRMEAVVKARESGWITG